MSGCGVDIVEVSRIKRAVEKNDRFLERIFSENEIEYFRQNNCRFEILAGFFAAKEAFSKLQGCGIRIHELSKISVEHETEGAPFLLVNGERPGVSLSISHEKDYAVAVVCGEKIGRIAKSPEMQKLIPKRADDAHKGDCGRVFIVAGSAGMTGAAVLSAKGALRSGCGLVTVGTPTAERHIVASGIFEAMTQGLEAEDGVVCEKAMKKIFENSSRADAVVFGPGLGKGKDLHGILKGLISEYSGSLVIDADGLNALSKDCGILKEKKCRIVITPHPGEMARLVKMSTGKVQENRELVASRFAKEHGVCVVLKGKDTVVADELGNLKINKTGNCGMATGGTGDVLAGVVASFLAQGLSPFDGAVLGAYIHGKAGDIAAEKWGTHGLVAGDVADAVPLAIKSELEN